MNFPEAENYLYSLGNEVETMKLGLDNIRTLLDALGNPQNNYKKVQVAGTNGKGSVCAFLDSICVRAGIRTGLYTSPHLVSITERIKIDGVDISDEDFARFSTRVREVSEKLVDDGRLERVPTFFEQVTAIALLAFAETDVELAILETGLGGRFDATTAANAEIAVITRIDLDHQEYLGDTIEKIAAEKAAIIRHDSIVCVGLQIDLAIAVIKNKCLDFGVKPHTLESARWERDNYYFDLLVEGDSFEEVALALKGEHQAENAALSILVTSRLKQFFPISEENIFLGLENARHPGRLEETNFEGVRVLMDGAHNPSGAAALSAFLKLYYPDSTIALVFGAVKDKPARRMLEYLLPLSSVAILTKSSNTRSMSLDDLADSIPEKYLNQVFKVGDVSQAFDSALQLAKTFTRKAPELIVVTGSLYLVGEVKKLLNNRT